MATKTEDETQKEKDLLAEIIRATREEQIRWRPTARRDEYTGSFNGRWSVTVGSYIEREYCPGQFCIEVMDDQRHRVLYLIDYNQPTSSVPIVHELFDAVSRKALHSDKGIDEFLRELKRA